MDWFVLFSLSQPFPKPFILKKNLENAIKAKHVTCRLNSDFLFEIVALFRKTCKMIQASKTHPSSVSLCLVKFNYVILNYKQVNSRHLFAMFNSSE